MDERVDVANVVASLGLFVDALRWNDLRALFAAEVMVDYTSLFGGEAYKAAAEDLIGRWQALLPGFTQTIHLIGAVRVTSAEGYAYAEAPVVAWHLIKDPTLAEHDTWLVGGRYEIQVVRQSGEWRIRSITLAGAWADGNLGLPAIARERVQAGEARENGI